MANKLSNSQKILFEQNYSHVLKAVFMYCHDLYMAEEATQEAFLQAFKNIKKLKDSKKFVPWVYTIAINILKKMYRRENKIVKVNLEEVQNQLAASNQYFNIELQDELWTTLMELDPLQRQVVILYYYFSLTLDEISDMIKVNSATVRSRFFRAKNRLKEMLMADKFHNAE